MISSLASLIVMVIKATSVPLNKIKNMPSILVISFVLRFGFGDGLFLFLHESTVTRF